VVSKADYCNSVLAGVSVWVISLPDTSRLQRRSSSGVLSEERTSSDHIMPHLQQLHWLKVLRVDTACAFNVTFYIGRLTGCFLERSAHALENSHIT